MEIRAFQAPHLPLIIFYINYLTNCIYRTIETFAKLKFGTLIENVAFHMGTFQGTKEV